MKKAQSLIEYGLILALVAVIAVTVLSKLGKAVTDAGDKAGESVNTTTENATKAYCDSLGSGYTFENNVCRPKQQ